MKRKKKAKKPLTENPQLNGLPPENETEDDASEMEGEVIDANETSDANGEAPAKSADHEALYKETLDRYTRTLAEFDNFRKRSIKEKAAQYDDGIKATAEKLLPVVDNFERAMLSGESTHADDTFYQGIALIARQFTQTLQDLHIEEIPAKPGDDFDTAIHYAVAHGEDENFGTNQVAQVLQKGYMHKDKVLRYSMVKVVN